MAVMIVAHPIPGFSGRVAVEEVGLNFIGGVTGPMDVPADVQAQLVAEGFTLNANPSVGHPLAYVTHQELEDPESEPSVALRAAFDPVFVPQAREVDPDWSGWAISTVSTGFDPATDPIWNNVQGVLQTDAMVSVRGGKGRWHTQPWAGAHLFEGWNKAETHRLTHAIGLQGASEGAIWTFKPSDGTFGTVRIGSDQIDKGFRFGTTTADFFGSVTLNTTGGFKAATDATFWEFTGGSAFGAGARNGAAVQLHGSGSTAPGRANFYSGSYVSTVDPNNTGFFFHYMPNGGGAVEVARIMGNGQTIVPQLRVTTSLTPATATSAGDAGRIAWDANFLYVCVATNTWKRAALSAW